MKEILFKFLCKSYFGSANMITKVLDTHTMGTVEVAMGVEHCCSVCGRVQEFLVQANIKSFEPFFDFSFSS